MLKGSGRLIESPGSAYGFHNLCYSMGCYSNCKFIAYIWMPCPLFTGVAMDSVLFTQKDIQQL